MNRTLRSDLISIIATQALSTKKASVRFTAENTEYNKLSIGMNTFWCRELESCVSKSSRKSTIIYT